jgi:hypothetical protein
VTQALRAILAGLATTCVGGIIFYEYGLAQNLGPIYGEYIWEHRFWKYFVISVCLYCSATVAGIIIQRKGRYLSVIFHVITCMCLLITIAVLLLLDAYGVKESA